MKHETLACDTLTFFDGNARKGNVEVISESLRINGQYRPIVVNEGTLTGRPLEVLAGNHTLKAALALGWESIEATVIDVSDDAATRIVAVDNRANDLATYDDAALVELLTSLDSLEGTGYTDEALTKLMENLANELTHDDDDDDAGETETTETMCPNCGHTW